MKKRKLFYIASILLLLSGCYDDISDILNDAPINKDGSIAFRTDSILTRGTPQDNLEAYDAVHLMVYSHQNAYSDDPSLYRQTELKKSKSADTPPVWEYSPHMFWPEGRKLSFLAYAVEEDIGYATATGEEGVFIRENAENEAPTIEYSVPTTDVTQQPDLLVTALLNHEKVNNVTLPMKHALSCVSFCATGPENMRVKNIQLKNIYRRATLELDDPSITWTLDPKSKDNLTVLEPGIKSDKPLEEDPKGNYLMTADGYLMMIPQTLTDATIDVTYQDETNNKKEITTQYTLPTTIVWEPGKKYIYKFGEDFEEVVVYYEKYSDGSYGFQWDKAGVSLTPLDDTETKSIVEAGYGVLTKSRLISNDTPTIQLGAGAPVATVKVSSVSGGYNLYAVSQTSINSSATFVLPPTPDLFEVFFDGNSVSCGKIIPHFAKGVSNASTTYAIRTPQQMLNISELTTDDYFNTTYDKTFEQERNLDFSKTNSDIGGAALLEKSVVDHAFCGTYNTATSKSISNVTISSSSAKIGLFSVSNGIINNVILKASSITGTGYVGGIVGENYWSGQINKPQVIGIGSELEKMITIKGTSNVGGIVGINKGTVTGNTANEVATETTVAEVSGWVSIESSGPNVGGIAGDNALGSINTVLVNGVFVKGSQLGELEPAKITIKGTNYVGGIAGMNQVEINGNVTAAGKNMPDVAGIVEITGANWVGGIAGGNTSTGVLNSVNIRMGREPAMKITGTGSHVGGIVGINSGELGTGSSNTFISVRGNIEITGASNVGGIVGNNDTSDNTKIKNCFVYDFQTQVTSSNPNAKYFAPKIICTGSVGFAGGIAGTNKASIENCAVFSVSDATLSITSPAEAGGIAGYCEGASSITNCSLIGKVKVDVINKNSGGIVGSSKETKIVDCWVGNSKDNKVIKYATDNLGLVITPPTGNPAYGIPNITGKENIGGIVGFNAGTIENITLSDNVTIGRYTSANFDDSKGVGGIVGGNAPSAVVKTCKVENATGKKVIIKGTSSVGGIVGLNNGLVEGCVVNASTDATRLTIEGLYSIGGIVGQNGGHSDIKIGENEGTGDDNTIIKGCKVTGYVTVLGLSYGSAATQVGGIVGLNGPNKDNINNVDNCNVIGAQLGSITIAVAKNTGGIVGTNEGNINECNIQNITITSLADYELGYAGGIAGQTSATAQTFNPETDYRSNIKSCTVYPNVTITGANSSRPSGALVGYLNSTVSIILGTNAQNKVSNSNKVIVDGSPVTATSIVGFATGGATINGVITTVP